MSRVIKFRAWIRDDWEFEGPGEFKMISGDTLAFEEYRPLVDHLEDVEGYKYLMQFTGLHDKNGKEIYEGDIIQWGGENEPMVVAWSDKYASFGIHRSGWMYMHFFGEAVDNTDCEVIGNIYQNPELTKA